MVLLDQQQQDLFYKILNIKSNFLKFNISTFTFMANFELPAFPGKQKILFDNFEFEIFLHKACSLPHFQLFQYSYKFIYCII